MEFDKESGKQLIDELVDLWVECNQKCKKIEVLIKEIYKKMN